jgi:predicted Zn-dependent protease
LGAARVLWGKPVDGLAELEEALALVPEDSWTRVLYGLVLLEAGRAEEAAEELVRAARERDFDAEAMILGALAAAGQEWTDAAEELLARSEFVVEGVDATLTGEAETAIRAGAEAAGRMLGTTLGPSALRERLQQPL